MSSRRKDPARTPVEAVPDPGVSREPDADDVAGVHAPATCPVAWCPVCLAVTAVQPVRPEAVDHLLRAGTEFFLALRSLIDARADDVARSTGVDRTSGGDDGTAAGGLEKIDIG